MYVKVHKVIQKGFTEVVVALCDDSVVGKTLGDDFFVNPRFYKGDHVTSRIASNFLGSASIINAVGKSSVGLLLKEGYVCEYEVVMVGGVPHAQVFVMRKL